MGKMLEADEDYFAIYGEPLFSSHMLDLSEEPDDENIAICKKYFERMVKMNIWLVICSLSQLRSEMSMVYTSQVMLRFNPNVLESIKPTQRGNSNVKPTNLSSLSCTEVPDLQKKKSNVLLKMAS